MVRRSGHIRHKIMDAGTTPIGFKSQFHHNLQTPELELTPASLANLPLQTLGTTTIECWAFH